MLPKLPQYGSPLLAILRGGKQTQAPKPVQFGVPTTAPTFPTALPQQTANTTRQTVQPAPIQVVPQMTPMPAPAINPLDIIRRGKELSFSQGTQDPSRLADSPLSKIPLLGTILAGKGKNTVYDANTFPGFLEKYGAIGALFEGFNRLNNPDREQLGDRIYSRYEKRIKAGDDEETALNKAIQDVYNRKTPLNMTGSKLAIDELRDPGLNLSKDDYISFFGKNLGEKLLAVVDAPIFAGTTKPVTTGVKGLKNTVLKGSELDLAEKYIDVARGTSPLNKEAQKDVMQAAQELANKYELPNRVSGNKSLANDFEAVLQNKPAPVKAPDPKDFPTAEEYVKAQKPLYHGTNAEFDKFDTKQVGSNTGEINTIGTFFAESTKDVDAFKKTLTEGFGRGETRDTSNFRTIERFLPPDAKVFDLNLSGRGVSVEQSELLAKLVGSESGEVLTGMRAKTYIDQLIDESIPGDGIREIIFENADEFKRLLSEKGYIGYTDVMGKGAKEFVVFEPNALKTRTQLIDEWKSAQPTSPKRDYPGLKSQGGYAMNPFAGQPKKLSEIDRLIADNKVRVVSRDGRDVYQVKKGGEWKNVRDEDSAIRQAGPRPLKFSAEGIPLSTRNIKPKRQLPDELEMKLVSLDIAKEALDANPAKELSRYISKRGDSKGTLAEVTGRQGSKTGFGTDVRTADAGFDNSEQARKAYDEYVEQKEAFKQYEAQVKQEVKEWKATESLRAKTVVPAKAVDQVRELQKVAPEQVRSLEEASQRMQEVLDVPRNQRPQPLEVIIPQTPVAKKVALWDYIRTPDRVLNKIGFGKEAKMLRNQYEKYVIELPKNIDKVSDWVKRVPKESNERIFDFLDGKPVKLNTTELKVAEEIKAYLAEWADRLKLPQDNRVTNYITRLFEDSLIAKEFDEDLAKIIADKVPGEVYNPFLQKRLGAKGYKRDTWGALDAYVKRATRKVHMDPALERIREKAGSSLDFTQLEESQFEYIQTYINRVQMRPTKMDNLIDNGVKQIVGYRFGQRPVAHVSQFLRRMTYRGMLGANISSAIRNLSQGINTYATLGEKYTVIGYAKVFNTNARKELAEQGVLAQNFIEDRALSSTKKALQKADKALWFFFDQAEKVNRGAAYFGAKAKGVNMGMAEGEAIEYAKSIVRKTQFAFDNVDAPVVMGTDLVKTLAQFQTFTVKQTEFLVEMAKDKNFVGLLRYAVAGYAFVNTVGQAMGMEEKELLPFLRFDVPPSLKFPWETAKLGMVASGVPLEDKYGNELDLERQAGQTGKSLLGLVPGGMQVKKTVDGINMVNDGAAFDRAGKKQFEQTDTPARKLQSVLFGKWASPQAKEYFNKDSKSGDKELDTALSTQKKEDARVNEEAQKQHIALKKLPKEEANAIAKELKANDPAVFEALKEIVKAEEKKAEWTDIDKNVAKLGVANGRRAEYIHTKASQMSKDEANAYIKDLRSKGIITDEVFKQIKELIQSNGIIEQ